MPVGVGLKTGIGGGDGGPIMFDIGAPVGTSLHSSGTGGAKTGRIPPTGGHDGASTINEVGTRVGNWVGGGRR